MVLEYEKNNVLVKFKVVNIVSLSYSPLLIRSYILFKSIYLNKKGCLNKEQKVEINKTWIKEGVSK